MAFAEMIAQRTSRMAGALAIAGMLLAGALTPASAQGPESVADVAERLTGAVVNISTSQSVTSSRPPSLPQLPDGSPFQEFFDEFFGEQGPGQRSPRRVQSLGSGFVIDPDGIIITNNHVIEDADEIVANFSDGRQLTAEIVGIDRQTDLAVLRVEPNEPLEAVTLGRSEDLRIGDWVMAIGNPFGLGGTVTVGIVSSLNRDIRAGPYDNFIQTDASINRGNSGGPLFNMAGEVVGINTAIISPSGGSIGIGFAIPTETARNVIDQLRDFGETRRGWIGVRIQEVTDDIAESLGMDSARGALVAGVTEDGPAAEAGIRPGDVILEFAGRRITAMRSLPRIVADTTIDEPVDVVLLRDGEEETVSVTVGLLDDGEAEAAEAVVEDEAEEDDQRSVLGLDLAALDDETRAEYGVADNVATGAVVTAVAPDSDAAQKGIAVGDVILEVGQSSVATPQDAVERVEALREEGRRSALMLVSSADGEVRFVAVRIDD